MAKMNVEGFDELVSKLEVLGLAGNRIANKALKEGAKAIVAQQKIDGPRHSGGPSNGKSMHGADALKAGKVTTAKSKNKYIQIGIADSGVWAFAKGVYFQHHGFYNHRSKKYIAGSQWVTKSFEKSKDKAAGILIKYLEKELKL